MSEDVTLEDFVNREDEETNERNRITGFGTFPSEWDKKDIVQCAKIRDSERIPLNSQEREAKKPGDIPYYGANGVLDYIDEYIFDSELILLAEDGGHFEEYQERPVAYRISGKAWVNNHAHILEAKEDTETEYLFYSLEHRNLVPYVSGSTRSKLTQTMLRKVKIPHPSLNEQRKIATILSTVDQAIEKTKELVNQTKQVKQGVTQDLLKNGINNDRTVDTDSRFGQLPESWELRPLKEVGNIAGRTAPEKDDSECWGGDIPWATPSEITSLEGPTISETDEHLTELALDKVSSNLLPPESVLLTTRATIGACAVNTVEMTTNQGFKNLIPGEDIDTWYAYYRLDYEGDYLASLSKGSTFPEVGKDTIENFVIPVPPLEEQREIGERLRSVHDQVLSYKENVSQLKRLKQGLMQDLLSGTVRTTDTNIEVPDAITQHG